MDAHKPLAAFYDEIVQAYVEELDKLGYRTVATGIIDLGDDEVNGLLSKWYIEAKSGHSPEVHAPYQKAFEATRVRFGLSPFPAAGIDWRDLSQQGLQPSAREDVLLREIQALSAEANDSAKRAEKAEADVAQLRVELGSHERAATFVERTMAELRPMIIRLQEIADATQRYLESDYTRARNGQWVREDGRTPSAEAIALKNTLASDPKFPKKNY